MAAGEGQIAQYGPAVTDVGSEVLVHAVPSKIPVNITVDGNLVRQAQRSWLSKVAELNYLNWNSQKRKQLM
jgi:hypothetical protein